MTAALMMYDTGQFLISSPVLCFFSLLGLALLISAIGFFRFIYFISVGYGFAISGMALFLLLVFGGRLNLPFILHGGLLILYGLRLALFLLRREFKPAYRKEMAATERETSPIVGWGRVAVWMIVSMLYVLMISPLVFQGFAAEGGFFPYLGVVVMAVGMSLEALADRQKSAFKQKNPASFCNSGLFAWVRCPNYFGEITFWTGNIITGLALYRGIVTWMMAIIGWIGILFVMLVSTVRLELKQDERYGGDTAFQVYRSKVPLILPFVPLYSLKNLKKLISLRV